MVAINNLYASRMNLMQQQYTYNAVNAEDYNVSLFSNTENLTPGMFDGTCVDGKDDGKIGLKEGIKSLAKGAIKSVTNMFSSPKNFVKTLAAGAAGAALIAVTGGAATPFLIAGGAIAGGLQAGKGIYQATQAQTDAEKREALENVGGGAATIAMSVAAGKSYAKSTTVNGVNQNLFGKGSLETYKNAYQMSKENMATNFGNLTSTVKTSAKTIVNDLGTAKASFKTTAESLFNDLGNAKTSFKATAEAFKNNFKANSDIIDGTFTEFVNPSSSNFIVSEVIEATSKGYKNGLEVFS